MSALSPSDVLALLPQQTPMRFIDEILEVDEEHILAGYTWTLRDCEGHFPGRPIVPGVKLIECAGQAAIVAWAIFHLGLAMPIDEIKGLVGMFTLVEEGAFKKLVRPNDRVLVTAEFGEEGYFRANKIVSDARVTFADGGQDEVFSGRLSGMWLPAWQVEERFRSAA